MVIIYPGLKAGAIQRVAMNTVRQVSFLLLMQASLFAHGQFLSHMQAVKTDALFTTYAASPARSEYRTDQGYQFQWFDNESGIEFISSDGPNIGIAFQYENRLLYKLQELNNEPVVTTSYSDLVKYYYYPIRNIRVEVFFAVFTSQIAIVQYRLINEGHFPVSMSAIPYIYYPSTDSVLDIGHNNFTDSYNFRLIKKRDLWMVEHNIPVSDTLTGWYTLTGCTTPSRFAFVRSTRQEKKEAKEVQYAGLIRSLISQKRSSRYLKGIIHERTFQLQPGDATSIRVIVRLSGAPIPVWGGAGGGALQYPGSRIPDLINPENLVREDEQAYAKIPKLEFRDRDKEMLYWSAFSLMRQCMMPTEGACHKNYYVFSR